MLSLMTKTLGYVLSSGWINMNINFTAKGEFVSAIKLLMKYKSLEMDRRLVRVGKEVTSALSEKTPVNTGELASGWNYELEKDSGKKSVVIRNSTHPEFELLNGLEYGHGTGTGGYVRPTHFISKTVDSLDDYISRELGGVVKDV